ncbi:MAG: dihydrodipicolinate synthase family protein, partial [Verrucomicrobia bacterium]|nr:dihydrodipicolinate synthase family protein [Verrucomicrobiota bacterium]
VISVASNIFPQPVVKMVQAALNNNLETASSLNESLYPLFINLFVEPNPVPVKAAMKDAGIIETADVRRPLCPISQVNHEVVSETVEVLMAKLKE